MERTKRGKEGAGVDRNVQERLARGLNLNLAKRFSTLNVATRTVVIGCLPR